MKQTKEQRQERKRNRMEEPPDAFCVWWNPTGKDELSGADTGGHPDAQRTWARKDPGRWVWRTYGVTAYDAWNTALYRREFEAWVEAGRPEPVELFVSLAQPLTEQAKAWTELKGALLQIGKPMPEPEDADEPICF